MQITNATVEITWDCRASVQEVPEQLDCHVAIANGIGHCRIIQVNYWRLSVNGDVQRAILNHRTVETCSGTKTSAVKSSYFFLAKACAAF